jgi:predicted nucleic acid-binding protein
MRRLSMNPPSVLLDLSFLTSVADTDDANHDEAVAIYRTLIDDFVAQRHLLVARADHLAAVVNADLFASVDKLHVARQHRNAAEELRRGTPVDLDLAITLVLIHRCKVSKVATFDERLAPYDLDVVNAPTLAAETEPGMVGRDFGHP